MTYIPPTEFIKLPKEFRDNYLEMAAELAVIHGLYNDKKTYGEFIQREAAALVRKDLNRSAAFNARLEYEKNCMTKYDRLGRASITPPEGERMSDFAYKFGCTVEEMKDVLPEVERFLGC